MNSFYSKYFGSTSLHLCCHHPNRNPCYLLPIHQGILAAFLLSQPRFLQSRLLIKAFVTFIFHSLLPETLQWCPMALGMKHKSITVACMVRCIPSSPYLLLFLMDPLLLLTTTSSVISVFDLCSSFQLIIVIFRFKLDYHLSERLSCISRYIGVSHTLRKNKNDF